MKATFLVELELDTTDLIGEAAAVQEDLLTAGHDVLSVKPWARPTLRPSSLVPPAQPPSVGPTGT